MIRAGVIVVAAGRGSRMGTPESKQFLPLGGKPVLVHTLERLERLPEAETVVLVTSADERARCEAYVRDYRLSKVAAVVAGGAERQHSVRSGLERLPAGLEVVAVHDGVRPFVSPQAFAACLRKAAEAGAAVLAVPVKDTIKVVDAAGIIESTPRRESLWAVQTPQAFRADVLRNAHERAVREGFVGTDDAMLVERCGTAVHVVPGEYTNIKITTPDDLVWAERMMPHDVQGESDDDSDRTRL